MEALRQELEAAQAKLAKAEASRAKLRSHVVRLFGQEQLAWAVMPQLAAHRQPHVSLLTPDRCACRRC
jgi:hypothetical protein